MRKQILLPVDDSVRSREAVVAVGQLLKDQADSYLQLLHCTQPISAVYQEELYHVAKAEQLVTQAQEKKGNEVLRECRRALLDTGFPPDRLELKLKTDSADPAEDILAEAEQKKLKPLPSVDAAAARWKHFCWAAFRARSLSMRGVGRFGSSTREFSGRRRC